MAKLFTVESNVALCPVENTIQTITVPSVDSTFCLFCGKRVAVDEPCEHLALVYVGLTHEVFVLHDDFKPLDKKAKEADNDGDEHYMDSFLSQLKEVEGQFVVLKIVTEGCCCAGSFESEDTVVFKVPNTD